jgi:hypothetical protein
MIKQNNQATQAYLTRCGLQTTTSSDQSIIDDASQTDPSFISPRVQPELNKVAAEGEEQNPQKEIFV